MDNKQRIAVIGSGISGLTCYHYLNQKYDTHLFEKEARLGGHTFSVNLPEPDHEIFVDLGFMVFNNKTYPILSKMLAELNVKYAKTQMSFSVQDSLSKLEYNGHTFFSLFNKSNFLRKDFYIMLKEVLRFNRIAKDYITKVSDKQDTVATFLQTNQFSELFVNAYFKPMVSSIWSTCTHNLDAFPIYFLFTFMQNHGLLNIFNRPQWYQITNGAKHYIDAICNKKSNIYLNQDIKAVYPDNEKVKVETNKDVYEFDKVILATHADTSLKLLTRPTDKQTALLQAFPYANNTVTLHTDSSLMPKHKSAWASWNFLQYHDKQCTLTYYLNLLQNLPCNKNYFVSVNLSDRIDVSKIIFSTMLSHPQFSRQSIDAQKQFQEINKGNILFCGAYWRNGFHEDGAFSAVQVCKQLGVAV